MPERPKPTVWSEVTCNDESVLAETFPCGDAVLSGRGFAVPGIIHGPYAPARRQMLRHFEVTATVEARCMRNEERFLAGAAKMMEDERRSIGSSERNR
jgi:hypothetical protein